MEKHDRYSDGPLTEVGFDGSRNAWSVSPTKLSHGGGRAQLTQDHSPTTPRRHGDAATLHPRVNTSEFSPVNMQPVTSPQSISTQASDDDSIMADIFNQNYWTLIFSKY